MEYREITEKPPRGSAREPDHIFISIFGDAKTSMAATWRTCARSKPGYMEYRPAAGGERVRVTAISRKIRSDIDESRMHWARAEGLSPGTKYIYTVGDGEYRSGEFSFETEPENLEKFEFIVITDPQNGSPHEAPEYAPVRELLKKALARHPGCRFIMTAGDNTNDGQNDLQWNGMFHGLKGIIESIPYMMGTGNHDNRGHEFYLPRPEGKFYLDHADFFDEQFEYSYPRNGPPGYTTENYSFDYGNAHFALCGINEEEAVGRWLLEDLQNSEKTWKLGAYHFPIYTVMPHGEGGLWNRLPEGIEEGRLDILFSGHVHSLARTYPMKNGEMHDRPSEGVVHYTAGNAGRNVRDNNIRKIWHPYFYPLEGDLGLYVLCEVDKNVLTVTAYLEDGQIADKMVIDKEKDELLPVAPAPVFARTRVAYRGFMPGLGMQELYAVRQGDEWYCDFGHLFQSCGAEVLRTPGELLIRLYGREALFSEGGTTVKLENGEERELFAPVLRVRNQLFIGARDAAEIFRLKWRYAEKNNLLYFDHHFERKIIPPHPEKPE